MALLQARPPATYAEWSELLDKFRKKEDSDEEILATMQSGTIAWQTGVAERFSQKLIGAVNFRMNSAIDKFQKDMSRSSGQERAIIQALLLLRKEFAFLYQAISLPVIPEKDRASYSALVRGQADKTQCALEESARKDRTGKLASLLRNNRVNNF